MPHVYVPVPLVGGVNRLLDQRRIGDAEAVTLQDMLPTRAGVLARRPALTQTDYVDDLLDSAPLAVARATNPEGPDWVFLIHAGLNAGTIYAQRADATIDQEEAWAYDAINLWRPQFANFNGRLYIFPGWGVATVAGSLLVQGRFVDDTDALQTFAFAGSGNSNWAPRVALVSRRRFWFWNLGENHGNRMVVSEDSDPTTVGDDTLTVSGRAFVVGDDGSGEGMALVEVMQTSVGSPAAAAVLALCQYNAFLITGEPATIASGYTGQDILGNLSVAKLPFNCGCASKETVAQTPYGTLWAGYDDVWLFQSGQVPVAVGTKIRSLLQANPPAESQYWFAGYRNGFYYLALRSADSASLTQPDETWILDLREGAPQNWVQARWYGPMKFRTGLDDTYADKLSTSVISNMFVDSRAAAGPKLLALELGYKLDRSDVALVEVEYDGEDPVTNDYLDAKAIYPSVRGKEYELGDPMTEKVYRGTEVAASADGETTLSVGANLNGAETTSETEIQFEGDGTERYLQSKVARPASSTRPKGRTIQPIIDFEEDSARFVIDARNDTIVLEQSGNPGVPQSYTFTHGTYDFNSLNALLLNETDAQSGGQFVLEITDIAGIFTLSNSTVDTWGFIWEDPGAGYTLEEVQSCRNFAFMLGFWAGENQALASEQVGDVAPRGSAAGKFEISGVGLHAVTIERRPA